MDKGSIEEKLRKRLRKRSEETQSRTQGQPNKGQFRIKEKFYNKETESKKSTKLPKLRQNPNQRNLLLGDCSKKTPTKKYEGEPGGKVDWFLKMHWIQFTIRMELVKVLKPATIFARSTDGNVRVRDVINLRC